MNLTELIGILTDIDSRQGDDVLVVGELKLTCEGLGLILRFEKPTEPKETE